jgi:hypothetical protein
VSVGMCPPQIIGSKWRRGIEPENLITIKFWLIPKLAASGSTLHNSYADAITFQRGSV